MFYLALTAWLAGAIFSFLAGNQKLPSAILILGVVDLIGMFVFGWGYLGISGLATLAVIILIVNKFDSIY